MQRIKIMGFSYGICAFMDCSIAAARGLGKSIVPMIIVVLGSCVFRVVWIYTVFAFYKTIPSLYLLYFFSWAITGAAENALLPQGIQAVHGGNAGVGFPFILSYMLPVSSGSIFFTKIFFSPLTFSGSRFIILYVATALMW